MLISISEPVNYKRILHFAVISNVPSFLHFAQDARFSTAESSSPEVAESASQTGVDENGLHPTCTPAITLHTLQCPSEWHNKFVGLVGHFPRVVPSPAVPACT